jgi:MFS family permease
MAIAILEYIQNGMLNFASSYVMGGIGAAPEEFSYAAMAYALCAVLALFNHRWCSERFGSKRFVQLSLLLYATGALCCACAQTPWAFIIGRAIQGMGGATFFTTARIEVNRQEGKRRVMMLLCFGYALLLGSALGPLLGSLAISLESWRWIFWGMMPWILAAAWASTSLSEEKPQQPTSYHPGAFICLVIAVFALQFLIQQTPYDWFGQPGWLVLLLLLALFSGLLFQIRHRRTASDLRHWRQLAQARYLFGLSFYFVCYFLVAANSYIMPVMVQQALSFTVPTTGLLLSVSYLAGILFATVYARLQLRFQRTWLRPSMILGCLLLAGFDAQMIVLDDRTPLARVAAILVLNGGFVAIFIAAVAQGTFREIEETAFAHAYQTKNIIRQIAISSATAVSVVFLQARNALHYARLSEGFSLDNPIFNNSLAQLRQALPQLDQNQSILLLAQRLAQQSTLLSCLDYFQFELWMALALAAWIFVQKRFI